MSYSLILKLSNVTVPSLSRYCFISVWRNLPVFMSRTCSYRLGLLGSGDLKACMTLVLWCCTVLGTELRPWPCADLSPNMACWCKSLLDLVFLAGLLFKVLPIASYCVLRLCGGSIALKREADSFKFAVCGRYLCKTNKKRRWDFGTHLYYLCLTAVWDIIDIWEPILPILTEGIKLIWMISHYFSRKKTEKKATLLS